MNAADVLGLPVMEQWYAIADKLFDQLAQSGRQMFKRVERLFLECGYLPQRPEQIYQLKEAFDAADRDKFNEAFLVRNCLVHNGGRVSSALARHAKQVAGQPIAFGDGVLNPLLRPMQRLADHLDSLWMLIL